MMNEFETMWDGYLERVVVTGHRTNLTKPDKTPIHQNQNRANPQNRELERTGTDKALSKGVIEPASVEQLSRIVFTPKKEGSLHLFFVHRRPIATNSRDSFTIPRMDYCKDSFGGTKVYSTVDVNAGYSQVEMGEVA